MVDLKSPDSEGSIDESGQSTQLTVKKRRIREKQTIKEDETSPSRVKELENLAAEAEKEAERENKARKMVEASEAPARWIEIREALRKEKELRLEMKRKIEMEEMNNPKASLPPPPPPPAPVRKRRRRSTGGANANASARASTDAVLAGSSSSGIRQSHQPLQITSETTTTTTTLGQLYLQSSQTSESTWHREDDPPQTLQLFPEAPTPDPHHDAIAATDHRDRTPKRVAVAVSRIHGEILTGTLNRFQSIHDLVVCCDCHNRMFTPEGFLNHAGWTLQRGDDPLKYIVLLN